MANLGFFKVMFLATVYCTTIQTISEGLIKFFNFKNSYKGVSPRKILTGAFEAIKGIFHFRQRLTIFFYETVSFLWRQKTGQKCNKSNKKNYILHAIAIS